MYYSMASKNISITEKVYRELLKLKEPDESFSELFLRLIQTKKSAIEKCFGAWNLTSEEKKQIWDNITHREGRRWNHAEGREIE